MCPTVHNLANPLEWGTIEIVQFDDVLLDEGSSMRSESSSTVVEDTELENVLGDKGDE
jgi:hypothetical protein